MVLWQPCPSWRGSVRHEGGLLVYVTGIAPKRTAPNGRRCNARAEATSPARDVMVGAVLCHLTAARGFLLRGMYDTSVRSRSLAHYRRGDAAQALRNTRDLAQHAERWGYRRYWVAEHHNIPGIASSATSMLIGYVAAGTATIRAGSGGVMLPNHAPLVIAEQCGTLEALYPGRIDLG
jgi:Luciferase-like monooxygenase